MPKGLRIKAGTAIALVLTLGSGCDYTPSPTPASSPSPSPPGQQGSIPIIVLPVASPGPAPVPVPVPVSSNAMFKIVMATPAAQSTINLPDFGAMHRPTLDFEFRYPLNLTLDDDYTNIEIDLLTGAEGSYVHCQQTDLGHSIRLDREDKVYLANSVALFRTGTWWVPIGPICSGRAHSSFTTSTVFFKLTPDVSRPVEIWTFLPMEWTFVRP